MNTTSRITELNGTTIRIIRLYGNDAVPDDDFLKKLIGTIKAQSGRMTVAIKRSRTLSRLKEKDAARDEQIRALKALLKGYCKFPDDKVSTAAERISAVFDKYGVSMARANYAEESALVESLLKDFGTASAKADIALLAGIK